MDEDGKLRPMTRHEMEEIAARAFEDEPESLADRYLNSRLAGRVEWLLFTRRFS